MKAAKKRGEIRQRPTMRMGGTLPLTLPGNPFKGEAKYASAGLTSMKKGIGVFLKVKF